MYIPQTSRPNPGSYLALATRLGSGLTPARGLGQNRDALISVEDLLSQTRHLVTRGAASLPIAFNYAPNLGKRSGSVNTTIGVVVGILLAVFLVCFFSFIYVYGRSIRFTKRKHHRRKGSKNSEGVAGAGGGDPPAAA
ncbi:hypothetical protein M426DRAFT_24840 [Hypoxylon sp. CI-4A]|nr:hypothetical protein M426DRAFT_24840 [Hypoxylon sp. CI-4A]